MATRNHAHFVFLMSIILSTTTTPALSSNVHGAKSLEISVSGRLCCSTAGNCPGPGVPGVPVYLHCDGEILNSLIGVAENITDQYGSFQFAARNVQGVRPDQGQPTCVVVVDLPIGNKICPILSNERTTANIVGVVKPSNLELTPDKFDGKVTTFFSSGFPI